MIKGYKCRIYPTKEQEELLWKHIHACRFIWNYMLGVQQERYENGEKYLSAYDMINLLKPLKNDGEHDWLYEVSNTSLQRVCQDLNEAYQNFFKKISGHPKFKSRKKAKTNYPARCDSFYFKDNKYLRLEKLGKVKYKTDFAFSVGKDKCKFSDVRVSYSNNKWFVSFGIECENQVHELTDKNMGIDLGVKELAIVAYDDKQIVYHNINKSKKIKFLEYFRKVPSAGLKSGAISDN